MVSLTVSVSETYDLSTKVGKMALLGIHTPRADIITRTWPGLLMQFKYIRPVACNVRMACASMLPADPLQIGVETGKIAPTDMFNPILYTAVSNDAMSTLEGRLHQLQAETDVGVKGPSVTDDNDNITDKDNEKVYYTLLSDRHGWRHAMPQQGLEMTGLKPLVYSVLAVNGQPRGYDSDSVDAAEKVQYPTGAVDPQTQADVLGALKYVGRFRGAPQPMPRIPTTTFGGGRISAGFGNVASNQVLPGLNSVDPIYVAMIVMPPAKLTTMYYRLVVNWILEFSGLRTQNEITGFAGLADHSSTYYHSDYNTQSQSMTVKAGLADTKDADLDLVMQGQ